MNGVDELDALSENSIRAAMRLDGDERPARFDAAAISP